MLAQWDSAVLEAVARRSKNSSARVHEEMKTGLYDLATIASIAPWIGIFGTILAIVSSFQGYDGPRVSIHPSLWLGLSRAMGFTAFGLLVGLIAFWSYEYLDRRLKALDLEMAIASLDLLNQLGRFPALFELHSTAVASEQAPQGTPSEDKLLRRCLLVGGTALLLDFLVQAASFGLLSACFYTPFMLATCCILVYPFWSRPLHRRPGAMLALASVLCLCWSLAELVLSRPLP